MTFTWPSDAPPAAAQQKTEEQSVLSAAPSSGSKVKVLRNCKSCERFHGNTNWSSTSVESFWISRHKRREKNLTGGTFSVLFCACSTSSTSIDCDRWFILLCVCGRGGGLRGHTPAKWLLNHQSIQMSVMFPMLIDWLLDVCISVMVIHLKFFGFVVGCKIACYPYTLYIFSISSNTDYSRFYLLVIKACTWLFVIIVRVGSLSYTLMASIPSSHWVWFPWCLLNKL